MENLYIEATKSTPLIDFNINNNSLKIKGESYPENSFKFYEPIFNWLNSYFSSINNEQVTVEFDITYLNTSSTKSIMTILDILNKYYSYGKNIIINWFYEEEDEFSYEIAEDFMEDIEVPFNLIKK